MTICKVTIHTHTNTTHTQLKEHENKTKNFQRWYKFHKSYLMYDGVAFLFLHGQGWIKHTMVNSKHKAWEHMHFLKLVWNVVWGLQYRPQVQQPLDGLTKLFYTQLWFISENRVDHGQNRGRTLGQSPGRPGASLQCWLPGELRSWAMACGDMSAVLPAGGVPWAWGQGFDGGQSWGGPP